MSGPVKARGGAFIEIGGEKYPILLKLRTIAMIEETARLAGVDDLINHIVGHASISVLLSAVEHGLVGAGMASDKARQLTDECVPEDFGPLFSVIKPMVLQLIPKKAEAEAGEGQTQTEMSGQNG